MTLLGPLRALPKFQKCFIILSLNYTLVIQLSEVQFSWGGVVIPKNFFALQFGERNSEAGSMTQWKIHRVLESDQIGFESQP